MNTESLLEETLRGVWESGKPVTVLTGAGISTESGIPTFRGPEGYWTVGSTEYRPREMATHRMFLQNPEAVWEWYLHRLARCRTARPNAGHKAIAEMERLLDDCFALISQNVDGLHLAAGISEDRTFQIHGNLHYTRCVKDCSEKILPLPESLLEKAPQETFGEQDRKRLRCPECGEWLRPHVLWFDEVYDELHFRYQSALAVSERTDLLIVVGTSGSTNLPNQVAWLVGRNNGTIINIDIESNVFANLAQGSRRGQFLQEPGHTALPRIVRLLKDVAAV